MQILIVQVIATLHLVGPRLLLYSHTHPPPDLLVSALDRDNSFPGSLSLAVADGDGSGGLKNPGSILAIKSAVKKGRDS